MVAKEQDPNEDAEGIDSTEALDIPGAEEDVAFDSASVPKQVLVTDGELRGMQKEILEYKDKYLRLLADSDNARKRLQKERQEISRYALEGLVIDFLRPLDNLENALKFAQDMSDDVRNWACGFQMILTQFRDVLAQHGINAFDSIGRQFDPHEHEALEMIETADHPPGNIIEEHIKGYRMGDRTIRAARVKVAKAKNHAATQKENQHHSI